MPAKPRAIPTLKAAPGCLIIEPYEEKSAIILSDTHKQRDNAGVVISVGDSYVNEHGVKMSTKVKKGDVIVHGNYNPLPQYVHYGKRYRIVRFQEVVGFISKKHG